MKMEKFKDEKGVGWKKKEIKILEEKKTLKDFEGKTIKKVWLERHKKDNKEEYNDVPFLFIEFTDGSIFKIESTYGGYTGGSYGEYPSYFIINGVDFFNTTGEDLK